MTDATAEAVQTTTELAPVAKEPTECDIRVGLILSGGYLPKEVVVPAGSITTHAGRDFFRASAQDRVFAMFMGRPVHDPEVLPWAGNGFIKHIMNVRNEAVNARINQIAREVDPMLETVLPAGAHYKGPKWDVLALAQLEPVIRVKFTGIDGQLDDHYMDALLPVKDNAVFAFEVTAANFNWLRKANDLMKIPDVAKKRKWTSDAAPNVKYN